MVKAAVRAVTPGGTPRLIAAGALERPHYAYIVHQAADLARRLGLPRISVLEFGVAGGAGLLNLEAHAARVEKESGVGIEIYGFDTGEGLPPPEDYRDLPYVWQANQFRMDVPVLEARLKRARLVLGLAKDTVAGFAARFAPAPIGAISFDLDYYSSTRDAFGIFDVAPEHRLPRIFTYLDDIISSDLGHVGPSVGVPLAIAELNTAGRRQLIALNHLETAYGAMKRWHRQIYSFCDFDHPRYNDYIIDGDRQLPI